MGLFRAKWSDRIHDEWISNLLAKRPDLDPAKLERTRQLMNSAVPDCLVTGYESIIDALDLPDEDDRHVLAAGIHCGADAIVTFNVKDFPVETLATYNIEPQHPDEFLVHQFGLNEAAVLNAARRCRLRLKRNPRDAIQYLLALERCGLPQTVAHLRAFSEVI
ncbi:PIN domain-containing protein [Bradyrhizobium sp. USDA 4353]